MEAFFKSKIVLRQSKIDIITGSIVVVLSLFMLLIGVPHLILEGYGDNTFNLSPRTIPRLVSGLMLAFGTIVLYRAVKKKRENDRKEKTVEFYTISFAVLALCIFFLLALKPLGYPITNLIMLVGMYYLTGGRKLLHGLTMAFLFTLVSTMFFFVYLKLSIPLGPLEFLFY